MRSTPKRRKSAARASSSSRSGDEVESRSCWRPLDAAELPALEFVERVRLGGKVDRATGIFTELGEHGWIWYALGLLAAKLDARRRKDWLSAVGIVLGTYALSTLVKVVSKRSRPPIAARGTLTGLSFPSSHTSTSFAAARAFSSIEPRAKLPAYALAAGLAASRIHFCVHYPSDIVAGAAIGEACARATVPLVIEGGN